MPRANEPDAEELREIGRRLCALVGLTPHEPVCAESLRDVIHDPACKKAVRIALTVCADELAALELPPELRELREATDEYARWMVGGGKLRARLVAALNAALPLLEEEADRKAEALANASATVLTAEERDRGDTLQTWPSPESLRAFPRKVLEVLPIEEYAVIWLNRVVQDFVRLDADFRIATVQSPLKTSIAKILSAGGGYSVAQIATVIEPRAKAGPERRQARNTVLRRLESTSEDLFICPRIDPESPDAAAITAEFERAAKFVQGSGTDVVVLTARLTHDDTGEK